MKFYSTSNPKNKKNLVSLEDAVINGLALDGGLYMPTTIPVLPEKFWKGVSKKTFQEIAFEMSKCFFLPDVPERVLKTMVHDAFDFDVPIVPINDSIHSLELFHGPTCAFKDFGARFMAHLLGYFAQKSDRDITILVATSGDTGSAVARGFFNVAGIKVIILYPSDKVSELQEKQLTTLGGNITALEVKGNFDDCQKLVKQAFLDQELRSHMSLASANSINIARLLPQAFYYAYAASRLSKPNTSLVVSVPSGNFGNLTAGLVAQKMGAPIDRFIASTNKNDIVPKYLETGIFEPRPSQATISNSMDVGNPSNFARMLDLYKGNLKKIRLDIYGAHFSDKETKSAMREVYKKYNYIMDPHGAVAYLGLTEYLGQHAETVGIFLETAHPMKFAKEVESAIKTKVKMPLQLKPYLKKKKRSILMKKDLQSFKNFLLNQK